MTIEEKLKEEDLKTERMVKWFTREGAQFASQWVLTPHEERLADLYAAVCVELCGAAAPGPERTVALRKLLESRDAALRAMRVPGG